MRVFDIIRWGLGVSAVFVLLTVFSGEAIGAEFYVAPDGSAAGDGSEGDPWDLETAFGHPEEVLPGDTIWLRGGTHLGGVSSQLDGEDGARITVRAYPGEWPVVDGAGSEDTTFTVQGSWTTFMGFEITNSNVNRWGSRPSGMHVLGADIELVNLVIHDLGNNGFWSSATDMLMHGCIIYHNGYDDSDRGHGHAIYSQNLEGTKVFSDNIIFGGYSFGFHIYTEGGDIEGYELDGNVWFNAGINSTVSGHKDDCLIGGMPEADRITLANNMGWSVSPTTRNTQLGYYTGTNGSVTLEDNYIVGSLNFSEPWDSITMSGNTVYSEVEGVDTTAYPDNDFLDTAPNENVSFVRPNLFDSDRAHLVVYNWEGESQLGVDVSTFMSEGDEYELVDGENPLGDPVGTGTVEDGEVSVPMDVTDAAQVVGTPAEVYEHTSQDFGVYILIRTGFADVDTDADSDSDTDPGGSGPGSGGGASGTAAPGDDGCSCEEVGTRGFSGKPRLSILAALVRVL